MRAFMLNQPPGGKQSTTSATTKVNLVNTHQWGMTQMQKETDHVAWEEALERAVFWVKNPNGMELTNFLAYEPFVRWASARTDLNADYLTLVGLRIPNRVWVNFFCPGQFEDEEALSSLYAPGDSLKRQELRKWLVAAVESDASVRGGPNAYWRDLFFSQHWKEGVLYWHSLTGRTFLPQDKDIVSHPKNPKERRFSSVSLQEIFEFRGETLPEDFFSLDLNWAHPGSTFVWDAPTYGGEEFFPFSPDSANYQDYDYTSNQSDSQIMDTDNEESDDDDDDYDDDDDDRVIDIASALLGLVKTTSDKIARLEKDIQTAKVDERKAELALEAIQKRIKDLDNDLAKMKEKKANQKPVGQKVKEGLKGAGSTVGKGFSKLKNAVSKGKKA